jgi:NurA-like 5'-3' nuclease
MPFKVLGDIFKNLKKTINDVNIHILVVLRKYEHRCKIMCYNSIKRMT